MAKNTVRVDGQTITTYLGNHRLKGINNNFKFSQTQIEEYLKCAADPVYFAEKYVKIVSLDEGIIPFDMWDFQREMIRSYSKNRFNITLASRQIGKSVTVICGFLLHEILFKDNQNIAILANKGALARDQLAKLKMSYELLPMWLQQGVVVWNKGNIELENGSKVVAAATTASSIRGNSYNCIMLDEFAHVEAHLQEEFFESTYPTLSSGQTTKMIIVSTPKGMNLFWKLWEDAVNKNNEFVPIRIDWWQVPNRDEVWKKETIKNIGQRKFDQEYGNEFIGSDATLISGAKLRSMVFKDPIIDDYNGLKIYQKPKKEDKDAGTPAHEYVITVDTAEGIGQDSSAFAVIDISEIPYKQVAVYNNNEISTLMFPNVIYGIAKQYNDAFVLIEVNMVGKQVSDILRLDLEYENIISVTSQGKRGQNVSGGFSKNTQFGLKTSTQTKSIGCSNLKTLIENDKILIHDKQTINELFTFVEHNNTFKAEEGKHDDNVMCLVIFGWLSTQKYFTEMVNKNLRQNLLDEKYLHGLYEELAPAGFFENGKDSNIEIIDGITWEKVTNN